ncbi:MAG TPA: hypothetical protein VM686_00560 [Polyangiaceae bacterium]|nr:hypothetical protein [Polyangiaceae bacterium]
MIRSTLVSAVVVSWALACLVACEEKAPSNLAPTASALTSATPAAAEAVPLGVDSAGSSVKFLMDSPLEKIDGDAPGSVTGELFVVPRDLTKSTGLIKFDLDKLTLYQQKRAEEQGDYSERKKNDVQNKHARDWLQIVPHEGEVTPQQAEMNRWVEFKLEKLETATPDVAGMSGAERKVTATVSGDFRLHGRKAKKSAKLELAFKYAGDKLESVAVKSVEPIPVSLEEFEVHPRDAAGKLTKTVTEVIATNLKGKLRNEAPIVLEFSAKAK